MVALFEIKYLPDQVSMLGDGFKLYDSSDVNIVALREISAFYKFSSGDYSKYALSGLFSPRFSEKMCIDGHAVRLFIEHNPNKDIYLFHPFPRELSIASNFLSLAELEHPGINAAINDFWYYAYGISAPTITLPEDNMYCCHCNFFVGSNVFWSTYSKFIHTFYQYITNVNKDLIDSPSPYSLSRCLDKSLPMAVFLFERCLSIFLKQNFNTSSIVNYAFDTDWIQPELFSGEIDYCNKLIELIGHFPNAQQVKAKESAVASYYYYRKLNYKAP